MPLTLPRTSDQSSVPGSSLVLSVGEREQLPALALEEGAGGVPDRLGTAEHHLLAAPVADEDHAPRRISQGYPSGCLLLRGGHALTPTRSEQGEPASTSRDLCFTCRYLNPRLRFNPLGPVEARMGVVVRDWEHKRRRRSFPYENRAYPSKPVARRLDLYDYHRLVNAPRPLWDRGYAGSCIRTSEKNLLLRGWVNSA